MTRIVLVLVCLALPGPTAGQQPWPEPCSEGRQTIFDRPVTIVDTLVPVPEAARWEAELGLEGRRVRAGDVELWVEEAGDGPPLVLMSGGPGTSHHYFHPDLIPAAGFAHLVWFDPRGVGRSDYEPGEGYTVLQAVDDLDALREALGFERWSLFGYSFGGVVAQVYTLRYPERVEGLVLASSAVPMSLDVGLGERQRKYMSQEEIDRVAEIYRVDGEPVVPARSDRVGPELQRRMLYNGFLNGDWKRRHLCRMPDAEIARFARHEFVHDRNYYRKMAEDYGRYDLEGAFGESPIPTLVLEGKWDLAFMPRKARLFGAQFPGARVEVFEEGGHTFFEDVPGEFFPVLLEFLDDLEPASVEAARAWGRRAEMEGYIPFP